MKNIKISIEGEVLDLPEEINSFKLTFALKDNSGVAVNTGTRSEYSFNFPATKTNDTIFKRFWNVGELNSDVQIFREAIIEVDGIPYFQGKAQLTAATAKGKIYSRAGEGYSVAFYGNNINWVSELKEKRLFNYPFSTHIFNSSIIRNSFSNEYPSADYSYMLIKLKSWNYTNKVQLEEFTPALSIAAIFEAIFNDLGYSINSNFCSSLFFQRLYMPILIPPKLGGEFSTDYLSIKAEGLGLVLNVDTSPVLPVPLVQTEFPLVGSNPYIANEYVAPYDGFYRFRRRINITVTSGTIEVFSDLVDITSAPAVLFSGTRISNTSSSNFALQDEIVLNLSAGQKVGFFVSADTSAGSGEGDFYYEVDGEAKVKTGTIIDFKYLIPRSWKSLDFIKGLAHAFNLTFQTNTLQRTITIEPSDSYLYSQEEPAQETIEEGFYTNQIEDKTRKIDLDKIANITSNNDQGEAIKLSWKYEGATEEAVNENEDLGFLSAKYVFPLNRFSKEEQVSENPFFYASLEVFDNTIKASGSSSPQIPLIWKTNYLEDITSSETVEELSPRIFYKEPYLATLPDRAFINIDDAAGGFTEELAPLFYMVNYANTSGRSISLAFGNNEVNGNIVKGLLDRFYLSDFKRKETGKEVEEFIFYNLIEINNLSFRNKVFIDNNRYLLSEVNSFDVLSNQSTKTKLLYDSQVKEADEDKVESPNITNKV